jgi:predicted RNA binding protein YcfA (HicA-like mRNA interferase family)
MSAIADNVHVDLTFTTGQTAHLVEGFGFQLSRTEGSHYIFNRPDIPELVNLQKVKGEAKPYQVRQFLKLVEKYNLKLEDS